MIALWMILEVGFIAGASITAVRDEWGLALFLLGLGIYCQGCRLDAAQRQREMIQRYGVRLNP